MSILSLLDRPIAFHRVFAAIANSVNAGVMLSQAVYWSHRTKDPDGWFYKSQEEWFEETFLSRREQETARKKLIAIGVLEEKRSGLPARLFFRVKKEALEAILIRFSSTAKSPKTNNQDCPNLPILSAQMSHASMSESANQERMDRTNSPIYTETTYTETTYRDYDQENDREDAIAQISEVSDQERQGRKNKTDREASPEFEDWWKGYRSLCRKLSTTTQKVNEGSKLVAIAEWKKLIAKGIKPETIALGTKLYETEKLREVESSGKAIGVPHGCRFLKNQIFNDEIERAGTEQTQESSEVESKQKRWDELRSQLQPLVDRGDIEVYIHTDGGHQELRARHIASGMITIESRLHWIIEPYQRELNAKSIDHCPF